MRPERGFTMMELLIVMALIGLLLSLSLPRYFGTVNTAKTTVLKQDLALMRDAIDKYYGDHGRYPDSLEELTKRRYLRRIPVDPLTGRGDTWKTAPPSGPDQGAVFDVFSGAQGNAPDGTEYARW